MGAPVGACIDHAHIHAVPVACADAAGESLIERYALTRMGRWDDRGDLTGPGYLWVRDSVGREFIGSGEGVTSQAGRRAVADALGLSDRWDWAVFPEARNVEATVRTIRDAEVGLLAG